MTLTHEMVLFVDRDPQLLTLPSTGGSWTDFHSPPKGGKTKLFDFIFFIGASATKRFQGQEFLVIGCLKIF